MSDDAKARLKQLAQQGQQAQARNEARQGRAADKAQAKARAERSAVLVRSLRGKNTKAVLLLVAGSTLGVGALAGLPTAFDVHHLPIGFIVFGTLALIGALTIGIFAIEGRAEARARAWIAAIPYRFDATGYLALLSREEMAWSLAVEVEFDGPVGEAERSLFARAVAGVAPRATCAWPSESRLRVTSEQFSTFVINMGDGDDFHTNAPVHAFFRELVDRCLPPMHAVKPIASLRVEPAKG